MEKLICIHYLVHIYTKKKIHYHNISKIYDTIFKIYDV